MTFLADPFSQLNIKGVYQRTWEIFCYRPDTYLLITLASFFVLTMLRWTALLINEDNLEAIEGKKPMLRSGSHVVSLLVEFVLLVLFSIYSKGTMTAVTTTLYTSTPALISDSFTKAHKRFYNLFCAGVLVFGWLLLVSFAFVILESILLVAGGGKEVLGVFAVIFALVFFVCLAYLVAPLFLLYPVIIVESKQPLHAIRRSFELSEGHRIYLGSTVFVIAFLMTLCTFILKSTLPFGGFLNALVVSAPHLFWGPIEAMCVL